MMRFHDAIRYIITEQKPGSTTFSLAPRTEPQGLGSATVPVAAGRVSRPASWLVAFHRFFFGSVAWRAVAFKKHGGKDVFGGTPNTAGETPALPGIAIARADPLKTSKKQKS
jgi:hypothetical protein